MARTGSKIQYVYFLSTVYLSFRTNRLRFAFQANSLVQATVIMYYIGKKTKHFDERIKNAINFSAKLIITFLLFLNAFFPFFQTSPIPYFKYSQYCILYLDDFIRLNKH
jgi:uncharacterized membrane protein (GlpM family)